MDDLPLAHLSHSGRSSHGCGGKCRHIHLHMLCGGSFIDSQVGRRVLRSDVRDATPAAAAPECQGYRGPESKSVCTGNTRSLNNLYCDLSNSFLLFWCDGRKQMSGFL